MSAVVVLVGSCTTSVPATWLCPEMPSTRPLASLVSVYGLVSLTAVSVPTSGVLVPPPPPPPPPPEFDPPPHPQNATPAASANPSQARPSIGATRSTPRIGRSGIRFGWLTKRITWIPL